MSECVRACVRVCVFAHMCVRVCECVSENMKIEITKEYFSSLNFDCPIQNEDVVYHYIRPTCRSTIPNFI